MYIVLEAVAITSVIIIVVLGYMRILRRKLRRYVLRWENIEKYFKEKSKKEEKE